MDEDEENILLADFEVHIAEIDNEWPSEGLVHEIKGIIKVIDETVEEQERPIGWLRAHLFNLDSLVNRRVHLMEPYDMRSQHLQDTFLELFDLDDYEFKRTVLRKTRFDIHEAIDWHLHISMLYINKQERGKRRGVRAMNPLRRYAERPGLLVSARAFPEDPDHMEKRPTFQEMATLARYYLSEKSLRFKQLGRLDRGWLIANWSI